MAYDLEGRYAEFMPIPVFKCEFGGKVVVEIKVSRKGGVESAKVIDAFSDKDDCLRETAVRAALRSRFTLSASPLPRIISPSPVRSQFVLMSFWAIKTRIEEGISLSPSPDS